MSQQFFGFDESCWWREFQIYNLGQQIIGGFRGVNSPVSVPDLLACMIDTEIAGNTVDPCIKLALSVETGQSSIGFKEPWVISSVSSCFVVYRWAIDRGWVTDNQMVES